MAHRFLRDLEADGWERSDFPIICESCLGDNPYVRMTKADYDKECKICTRPFTVFRWRPGRDARFKKTEVCQTCSKLKNVCQVCLLDLEYGLPVQVRDTALAIDSNDSIPKSDVNRARAGIDYESSYGKARPNDTILKLQRTTPYYKENRAHVCSFFVRNECTEALNVPIDMKCPLLENYAITCSPDDQSIKTLYIGGLDARVTEQDLRDNFYSHGEIESVRMVLQRACAFETYTTREGAEKAAEELSNKLVIKGLRLKLLWGRSQAQRAELENQGSEAARQQALTHGGYYLGQSFRSSRIKSNPRGSRPTFSTYVLFQYPTSTTTRESLLPIYGSSEDGCCSSIPGRLKQRFKWINRSRHSLPLPATTNARSLPTLLSTIWVYGSTPTLSAVLSSATRSSTTTTYGSTALSPATFRGTTASTPFQQQPPGAAQPQPPHEHKPSDPPSSSSN
ncbi:hypothetical protein MKW92_031120 [Papaver armeniacum]|nr:hypothetical protein MKW92_031120 [Papaver armeniacum]